MILLQRGWDGHTAQKAVLPACTGLQRRLKRKFSQLQAKQEADAVLSMAADANVMPNGDTPAAPAAADNLGQADVAAKCVAAAPQETDVKASEAPVKVTHLMPALLKLCLQPWRNPPA